MTLSADLQKHFNQIALIDFGEVVTGKPGEWLCGPNYEKRVMARKYFFASYGLMVRKILPALELIDKRCLCERFTTHGFDYHEEHPEIGKPRIGERWLTPKDLLKPLIAELKE